MVTKTRPEINTLTDAKASLRAAEAALEQSIVRERQLKEAVEHRIAEFAHDVKNPLNAMLAYSEVIKDELMGPIGSDLYKEYVGIIHTSVAEVVGALPDRPRQVANRGPRPRGRAP